MPASSNINILKEKIEIKVIAGVGCLEKVSKGDRVKVEYIGSFPEDGEVFDASEERGPLEFEVGAGQMIKGFDKAVLGMKLDEEKDVTISPEEAYGSADGGQKIEMPVGKISTPGQEIKVGTPIATTTGQVGKVTAVRNGIATLEFVHPMAGRSLHFWIKVVEIKKQ